MTPATFSVVFPVFWDFLVLFWLSAKSIPGPLKAIKLDYGRRPVGYCLYWPAAGAGAAAAGTTIYP